jgi:hypothetical protein
MLLAMSFSYLAGPAKVAIHFDNYVNNTKLALDTATYTNALGQPFTVTNFKYYISDIELAGHNANGRPVVYKNDKSYLVRQDDATSAIVALGDVGVGSYDSISFLIGVDSLRNCSGAQSGALDPINGMFWTWSTGYIFMKLEGKAPASKSSGHIFEYHIGGYREPNNFIRRVSLPFLNGRMKTLTGKTTTLFVKTDAAKVLQGASAIDFSKLSSVTDFHHADKIADNYVSMFSVMRISNEW